MFTKLIKLQRHFFQDESGQGTIEFAAMLALGAILALSAWNWRGLLGEAAIDKAMGVCAKYLGNIL